MVTLPQRRVTASRASRAKRERRCEWYARIWAVEHSLHWTLDIAFREDESRTRIGHAQKNLALVRKLALALLRKEKNSQGWHEGETAASRVESGVY